MNHPKIVVIGAGSVIFTKSLVADILWHDALKESEIRLVDIDRGRLRTSEAMVRSINRELGAGARIRAFTGRRAALDGADVVLVTIKVPGEEQDLAVAARFGVRQMVGDTVGSGGVFRAARTIPELLRLCADMRELCPRAWLLNYTNPMAMNVLAIARAGGVRHVGLCHGVQHTAMLLRMIAALLETKSPAAVAAHFRKPFEARAKEWREWMRLGRDPRLDYLCAGINHMAFFLRLRAGGGDLYPALRRAVRLPAFRRLDPVRMELFERLEFYMTESSSHAAEYVPYFLGWEGERRRLGLDPASRAATAKALDARYRAMQRTLAAGEPVLSLPYEVSPEYASKIILAMVTGQAFVFNGNVANDGPWLSDLPPEACVEVPCRADRRGIRPARIGALPLQCAALIRTNVNVQLLAVHGILNGDRQSLRQAIMLDPATAAQIPLPQMDRMIDMLFRVHERRLPEGLRPSRRRT